MLKVPFHLVCWGTGEYCSIGNYYRCVFISDPAWLQAVNINLAAVNRQAIELSTRGSVTAENRIQWAMKALRLTDLTTLAGDDTASNVQRLCLQAVRPFSLALTNKFDPMSQPLIHTAAVCVYPARVEDAYVALSKMNKTGLIPIAAGEYVRLLSFYSLKVKHWLLQRSQFCQGNNKIF